MALLDVGANAEARPEHLLQFAVMGAAYAEHILGIERPRVGLVSIGEERGKGSALVQAALPLLEAAPLSFVGNIEGHDIPLSRVDVAVTDGFTGNVMLKLSEGIASLVTTTLKREAKSDVLSALGGLLMRPALGRIRRSWDYRGHGGAMLLGVRGAVVIGHGRSDAMAVASAVAVARRGVEHHLVDAIAEGIARAEAAVGLLAVATSMPAGRASSATARQAGAARDVAAEGDVVAASGAAAERDVVAAPDGATEPAVVPSPDAAAERDAVAARDAAYPSDAA